MVEGNPMRRTGEMPELANLAVYLLSPGSAYVNGQIIAVDGAQFQAIGGIFSNMSKMSDDDWLQARAAIARRDSADKQERA